MVQISEIIIYGKYELGLYAETALEAFTPIFATFWIHITLYHIFLSIIFDPISLTFYFKKSLLSQTTSYLYPTSADPFHLSVPQITPLSKCLQGAFLLSLVIDKREVG